ncbi:MAG TPA: hypothetical protein VM261_15535 [Kofleriaceae bacterium]|nr:hypothetical protein [Kofleriaceae bacterium]
MRTILISATVAVLAGSLGACSGDKGPPPRTPEQRGTDSAPAVTALQAGTFDAAAKEATAALALDPRNAQAAAVRAIAGYQQAGSEMVHELGRILEESDALHAIDHVAGRQAWQTFIDRLDAIDRDLAVVAADPGFSLELCLACWEHDWNHSGEIDDGDRRMFEIEYDGNGEELPEGDPRRRPTFRFDTGDAEWARAMLSFQRAGVELVLAYKWSELDQLFRGEPERLVIRVNDAARVKRAREHILRGVDFADRCRAAYLAETDDDREWVPNPRQKSFAVPLAVDDQLYATWSAVTRDVRHLLRGDEGISMREVARLVDDDLERLVPDAYVDLGKMLAEPSDIVIEIRGVDGDNPKDVEKVLRGLLGKGYATRMKPSPLVGRLNAMKQQLDRNEDTMERKLRYLFWLN